MTTTANSKTTDLLRRRPWWRVSFKELSEPKDEVSLEIRTFSDSSRKTVTTTDVIGTCRYPLEIWASQPIDHFWGGLGERITPRAPFVPVVPGYNYAIRGEDIFIFGQGTGSVSFNLARPVMDEIGASKAMFRQRFSAHGLYGGTPDMLITNIVEVPERFDTIAPSAGAVLLPEALNDERLRAVYERIAYTEDNEMVSVGTLDRTQQHTDVTVACVDSAMKRVEDLLGFVAAAIFGTAVGGLFELVLAMLKGTPA